VAKYLRVHTATIYKLLKARELPAFRIGADWRFKREHIDEWRTAQEKRSK
jgi:excisionase family DNA binding protein